MGLPDFYPGGADVRLKEVWETELDNDKLLEVSGTHIAGGGLTPVSYVVPAGKILYITYISFWCHASLAADMDNNTFGAAQLKNGAAWVTAIGGNGGAGLVLPAPEKFVAGETATLNAYTWANHATTFRAIAKGYEVDA